MLFHHASCNSVSGTENSPAAVFTVSLSPPTLPHCVAMLFLRRQFADEGPGDLGGLPIVVMHVKPDATFIFEDNLHRLGFGGNFVGLADGRVRFEKAEPVEI